MEVHTNTATSCDPLLKCLRDAQYEKISSTSEDIYPDPVYLFGLKPTASMIYELFHFQNQMSWSSDEHIFILYTSIKKKKKLE